MRRTQRLLSHRLSLGTEIYTAAHIIRKQGMPLTGALNLLARHLRIDGYRGSNDEGHNESLDIM